MAGLLLAALVQAPAPGGSAAAGPAAGPRVRFATKSIDLGTIIAGEVVRRRFAFTNAGDAPLEIRAVKPSCGCTAALVSAERLAPGESGQIEVRYDSADRRGFQRVRILVITNDPHEQDAGAYTSVLELRVEVRSLLEVLPLTAYFPSVVRGSQSTGEITVLPSEDRPVRALEVRSTSPFVLVRSEPLARGGKQGFKLLVSLAPDIPLGRLEERIEVRTDHERQPRLRIPVLGLVHGPIIAFPDRLQLPPHEPEAEATVALERVAGEGPIPLERIEPPPGFEVQSREVLPGKRTEIVLRRTAGLPPGPYAGVLRIFLREPAAPLFEIAVLGEKWPQVRLDPPALWLAEPAAGAILRAALPAGHRLLRAEIAAGPFTVERLAPDRGLERLRVRLDPEQVPPASGVARGLLLLRTDVPGEQAIQVVLGAVPDTPSR